MLPTAATLSGPSTGIFGTESTAFTVSVNQPAWTGGVTVTPGSTSSGDTFQATSGGSNVSSVTIPAGSTSATFYLMPGGTAGNRSISITTSPALSYSGSPITYNAAVLPTAATLSGPSTGIFGTESTAFTVSVNQPAWTGGVTVTPGSTSSGDTFQATSGGSNVSSVTIPAGSTSVTFYLMPGGTAGNRSISITTSPALSYSGSPITYNAAVLPTAATLSGPSTGIFGTESTAFTVSVNQPAWTGGVTVTPGSTSSGDTFQATSGGSNVSSVTIPAGSTSVTFYLMPGGTAGNRSISITTSPALSYSGSPITYNAAVLPTAATLSGPSTGIFGTESTAFTVSVNQPAWTGGVTVTPGSTSSGDTFQATSGGSNVSSVTIPAGSTSVTFYLMPGGTAGNRSISITTSPALSYSGSPITYNAAVLPTAATLSGPSTGIFGTESTTFTVSVNQPAWTGGVTVTPGSTSSGDTFQATSGGSNVSSVTIPAGSTSVTFYLMPGGTAGNRSISITTSPALSYSGSPITYNAAVLPTAAALSGPSTGIFGTESTAFTVSVNQPAWTGGVTVTPGSTSSGDTFQATSGGSNVSSVTIPAGSTSATFYLMPGGTAGNRSISITSSPALSYSGSPITYNAAALPTVATLSGPTSGGLGVESTAFTVTLDHPAWTGGVTVTPASTNGSDTFQAT